MSVKMFQLLPHDFATANRAKQSGFVENAPKVDRIVLGKQFLSGQPHPDAILNLLNGRFRPAGPDQTAGVIRNLQQPGYTLGLVRADTLRGRFETDIGPRQYRSVRMPPSTLTGFPRDIYQILKVWFGDVVQGKHVAHVPRAGASLAILQP